MTMISRNWNCLNPRCGKPFHSYEKGNPPCPACGCVRVGWIPGGGHVGTKAARVDATARSLADTYKLTNINTASPSRLNRSKPPVPQPPVEPGPPVMFAPGFSAPVSRMGATCSPSSSLIRATGKVRAGNDAMAMPHSGTYPRPQQYTRFVGKHVGGVNQS